MNPWNAAELNFDAGTFSGVARLFPLPNLVLYPHVMQPLHIFEDRYREMVEDALAGDQLITMSVLEPGWETDYESRPPVSQHACLGKIVAHHRLDDGRYNLLLLGVQRVRILNELDPIRSFRQVKVELIDDCYDFQSVCERSRVQEELMTAFRTHLPCTCELPEQMESMLTEQLPLGLLTDLAAYALPLSADVKMQLLAECRVSERAALLLGEVKKLAAESPKKHRSFSRRVSATTDTCVLPPNRSRVDPALSRFVRSKVSTLAIPALPRIVRTLISAGGSRAAANVSDSPRTK